MTTPLPDNTRASATTPRSAAERERARVKLARKWAYLVSTITYVPLVHAEIERPLLELVHAVFDAVAREPLGIDDAAEIGTRLVELNCVDKKSLQCTVDVLAAALLNDPDLQHLDRLPERVARVLGAVGSGFAEAIRRSTADQQDSMCRALIEVARKAVREQEACETKLGEMSTELSLLRGQLSHQLLHDVLTGLPNRQFFTTRLEQALNSGSPTTVYRLELNGFSLISDGLGKQRGDSLLTAIAERIRAVMVNEKAMVARFDGASFAILQESSPSTSDAVTLVKKINDALTDPTCLADLGLATAASIGVVQSPPHRADPVELLHAADMALRYAKQKGPGQWELLTPDEDAHDRRLLRLAAIMPGAWETGKLEVGYRLRVRLADDRPVGVSAFVRWQEAELHGGPRHRCVELAEQTGLSPQLGRWLLRSAGEQLKSWSRRSGTDLPLAVSLSPNQSSAPDLVDTVLGILDDTALRAERLQIAMPAIEVFNGREQAVENLTLLAEAGAQTAVHDFGGGAEELIRLADLPLRAVWIAPHLVWRARQAGEASLVAKTLTGLVTLVHLAEVSVCVDDIQSRKEADWWRWARADTATGSLFSSPDEPTDIASLFTSK